MRRIVSLVIVGFLFSSLVNVGSTKSRFNSSQTLSVFGNATIDGTVTGNEWNRAANLMLSQGFLFMQNDASNLYLLVDLINDTHEDSVDYFWLSFDVDLNHAITAWVDVNYGTLSGYVLAKQYYLGSNSWTTVTTEISSRLGAGFGSSPNSATSHRIWELAISLSEIGTYPNGLVRLGLRTHSESPYFNEDQPENFINDFSNLIEIALATAQVDLLVLADESFCDMLKPLKTHKDYTGINTHIESWQTLNASFSNQGRDVQERIKKGIANYEHYCETKYVMLVGDCDKFPVRYIKAYETQWGTKYYPSDLYYADLYDDVGGFDCWDYDDDNAFGEMNFTGGTDINKVNLDQINMYPDVMVGRIPASTVSEVTTYVDKVVDYEFAAYGSDWFKKALYVVDGGPNAWGTPAKKDRLDGYLTDFTIIKRYLDYPAAQPWNASSYEQRAAELNSVINDGVGFVNHYGHGNRYVWSDWYDNVKLIGVFDMQKKWNDYFCIDSEIPSVGDFNGDGKDDIVTFVRDTKTGDGQGDVYVALSTGSGFGPGMKWHDYFCLDGEWPEVGDVNGDGKDDIITFQTGTGDVYVALSTGSSFGSASIWLDAFWVNEEYLSCGDFNGDGKCDIIRFQRGVGDVFVSLSSGSNFGSATKWHDYFCLGGEVPAVGDFDGDGKDDIVTFIRDTKVGGGQGDVCVALSSGTGFGSGPVWHGYFCLDSEVPGVGDFNGDGKDDIVTFVRNTKASPDDGEVYVALSSGSNFGGAMLWLRHFCNSSELPDVGDFNGDGADDLASFVRDERGGSDDADVDVALSVPLKNEERLPVVFSFGCYTARFYFDVDYYMDANNQEWNTTSPAEHTEPMAVQPSKYDRESMAEEFLVKRSAGAIAYVGCESATEHGGVDLDKYFFESYYYSMKPPTLGALWNRALNQFILNIAAPQAMYYFAYLHIHKMLLFGDPSLRVGGVSTIQKQDFVGTYSMMHDGWKGMLELKSASDSWIDQHPNIVGNYSSSDGIPHKVYGKVRTWAYPLDVSWGPDHKIEFYIDFADTVSEDDDQKFEGYLFTGARDVIAGTTWWNNRPFGFYALKGENATAGVSGVGVDKEVFLGTYDMNHDGWKGKLELKATYDDYIEQHPNIQGTYTDVDGKNHSVYGYVRTPTYPLPQEWGPNHKIAFSIDFADTPQEEDDQEFEGYLFTWTKDVIAGTTKWNNIPFGFYANRTSAPHIQTMFNITIGTTKYDISIFSNSTIENFAVSQAGKQISFNVTGLEGTCGLCNVTIPKGLLWGALSVHIDGSPLTRDVDYAQLENGTHNIFCIGYTHSTHLVEIRGTEIVPESPSLIIIPLFTLLILAAALLKRKRRELSLA